MTRICIPDYEYQERIQKAAKLVAEKGLDAMLVVSTESDYANARYFSGFWPLFERAGVFTYSREEDTAAYDFENQIDEQIKQDRMDLLMREQLEINE